MVCGGIAYHAISPGRFRVLIFFLAYFITGFFFMLFMRWVIITHEDLSDIRDQNALFQVILSTILWVGWLPILVHGVVKR